jgi:hypothetical protein
VATERQIRDRPLDGEPAEDSLVVTLVFTATAKQCLAWLDLERVQN